MLGDSVNDPNGLMSFEFLMFLIDKNLADFPMQKLKNITKVVASSWAKKIVLKVVYKNEIWPHFTGGLIQV